MLLEELVNQVAGFDNAVPKERIKLFAWWLHVHDKKDFFTISDIRGCFASLHIGEPPSLSTYIARLVEAKDFLQEKQNFKLSRGVRVELDRKFGVHQSAVAVSKLLTDLIGKVSDVAEQSFLAEAIKCYRVEAYRACIVMVWNVTYNHLLNWILHDADRLAKFNANIAKRNSKKSGVSVAKYDDFEDFKEREVIDICNIASLYNASVYKILVGKLDRRNISAHPSTVVIVQSQADDTITDLVNNVVLGLQLGSVP
jgi:hypothetical protein